jgi:hypothetical protein
LTFEFNRCIDGSPSGTLITKRTSNLFCVLRFAVSKGPVLFTDFHQIDEYILAAKLETVVQPVCDRLVKGAFLVDGSPGIERDLDEHAIFRSLDTEVAGVKYEALGWMLCYNLEAIVLGNIQDLDHSVVDHLSDGAAVLNRFALSEIDSNQRHKESPIKQATTAGPGLFSTASDDGKQRISASL